MARSILTALVMTLIMCSFGQAQLELAQFGQSKAIIVVSDSATDREKTAAEELQKYLGKITGAEFAISNSPNVAGSQSRIFVGQSPVVHDIAGPVDWESLGSDGIVIKTVGKDLILAGGPARGTPFAVYTFLQDKIGCRWWTPDEESIPSKPNLTVPAMNIVYRPPLNFRRVSSEWALKYPFAFKLRLNGNDVQFDPDGGSILRSLLPGKKYFVEHPEWYAYYPEGDKGYKKYTFEYGLELIKERGTKKMYEVAKKTRRLPWQPCMTNEQVLKTVKQNVMTELKQEYPTWKYPPKIKWVVQEDWFWNCKCDRCAALREAEGTDSTAWLRVINAIAECVEKEYPDVLIGPHAYLFTIKPPKTLKPRDNVVFFFAVLMRDHKTSVGKLTEYGKYARQWAKIAKHLYLWDYTANFSDYIAPDDGLVF